MQYEVTEASQMRPADRIDLEHEPFLMFVLDELANQLEAQTDDVIRLTLGKSELSPSPSVTEAIVTALRSPRDSSLVYPGGLPELRHAIAQSASTRYQRSVAPENVIISAGTSTLIRNVFDLLVEPGEEVLVPRPYYPLYTICARLARARITFYEIDTDTLRVDPTLIARAISPSTRLVVVNTPGNPLGNVMSHAELAGIDAAVGGRATILFDEMYGDAAFDEAMAPSALHLREPLSPFVVTAGFSKSHRMYARRIGYAIVPRELAAPLTIVQHHTLLTADTASQFGAVAALGEPDDVESLRALYRMRRNYTMKAFAGHPSVRVIRPEGGFYLTLDCTKHMTENAYATSLELALAIADQAHVATVPGSDFGLPTTLRLSFTASRYEDAVDRLTQFFS